MLRKSFKLLLALGILLSFANAADKKPKNILKSEGVSVTYEDPTTYEEKTIEIKRIDNEVCRKVKGVDPNVIWGGDFANDSVPKECKKTFVTTIGKLSPVKIADGIDTYGELEVIEYIKKAQKDDSMLLVDARLADWYKKGTIPTAVNLPFKAFDPKNYDFEIVLDKAGVVYENGKYDFSEAKTMLLFCNGIWCPQSTWAIENLLKLGYPKEKLKWYRGGMYAWRSVNLTVINP